MPRSLPEPTTDSLDLTTVLGALADPARRAIMVELARNPQPMLCSALEDKADLGLAAATVSHHYRVLREAGLTHTVVVGRQREIRIRRDDVEARFPGLLDAVLRGD